MYSIEPVLFRLTKPRVQSNYHMQSELLRSTLQFQEGKVSWQRSNHIQMS